MNVFARYYLTAFGIFCIYCISLLLTFLFQHDLLHISRPLWHCWQNFPGPEDQSNLDKHPQSNTICLNMTRLLNSAWRDVRTSDCMTNNPLSDVFGVVCCSLVQGPSLVCWSSTVRPRRWRSWPSSTTTRSGYPVSQNRQWCSCWFVLGLVGRLRRSSLRSR